MYGVPLFITIGHSDARFRPPIMDTLMATSESNNTSQLEQMRQEVVRFFGFNNVFVGFKVGWALTALQLPIRAERVVDLSVQLAFANFTCNLAQATNMAPRHQAVFKKQKALLDRRWPAALFEDGIEFRQNHCDNVYGEAIQKAAVLRAVSGAVIKSRQILVVRRIKAAYCIGGGPALKAAKTDFANAVKDLLHRSDPYGDLFSIKTTPATRDDFFRWVETVYCDIRGLLFTTTLEAYLKLIQNCDRLALKAILASSDDPQFEFFAVDPAIRCQLAVDAAQPAKFFQPKLMVAWPNHLSDLSICGGFRYLELCTPLINNDEKLQRLILCFIDFADTKGLFSFAQFREALAIGARSLDFQERKLEAPANVETAPQAAEAVSAAAAAYPAQVSTPQPRQSSLHSSDPIYGYLQPVPLSRARSPLCLHPPSEVSGLESSAPSGNSSDAEPLPLVPPSENKKNKLVQKKASKKHH